ncbi:MAG: hypothetical protein J0H56_11635 [Micrococcales bacterium]|nr:hypothetical protein [Micrococcales bacterium]
MAGPGLRGGTGIGDQPALRTSTGRSWLIVGALMMVICGGILLALSSRQPLIGFLGAGIVAVLYALMVLVSVVVRRQRVKLVTLAVLLVAMAATALGFVLVISATEWAPVV